MVALFIDLSVLSLPVLPQWPWLVAGLPMGLFLLSSKKRWLLGAGFISVVYFVAYADRAAQALLPAALFGSTVSLSGSVVDLPVNTPSYAGFVFKIDTPMVTASKTRLLRVHWYRPTANLSAGDYLQLDVVFKPPKASVNTGLGNYENRLFFRGIQATAVVSRVQSIENRCSWHLTDCYRSDIRRWLSRAITDTELLPMLLALTIGDSSQWVYKHRRILAQTGTQHLFVISGLHIGLVAWLCARLFHYIGLSYQPRLVAAFGCSFMFAALAGFSLSVQRALLMIGCYILLALCRRSAASYSGFSVALALVLVINPLAGGDQGFWFSFAAVAVLVLSQYGDVYWANKQKWFGLLVTFRVQACLFMGLAPLVLSLSGELPALSVMVNLVAIPWLSLLVVPLLLALVSARLATGNLEHPLITNGLGHLLQLSEWLIGILWWLLEFAAEISPVHALGSADLAGFGLAGLAIVMFIVPFRLSANWLLVLSVLPLANLSPIRPQPGELFLTVFDVGQGLSVYLQTRNKDYLYDTGSKSLSGSDRGQSVVLPSLRLLGVNKLDKMILSHADTDHVGGARSILQGMSVGAVLGAGFEGCNPAKEFEADGVEFRVFQVMNAHNDNNNSCLLLIRTAHFRVLITGDIEAPAELELVSQLHDSIDLMTVPHHGSGTSSSPALLNHFMPEQAIIASGYQNPFGHPAAPVIERYRARAIVVSNTATSGAVSFSASEKGVVLVAKALPLQQRFWQYQRWP